MPQRVEKYKLIMCLAICVCLVSATIILGDRTAVVCHDVFSDINRASAQLRATSSVWDDEDKVSIDISGYGGGGYGGDTVSSVPSDISALMEQAEEVYSGLKKSGDIEETYLGPTSQTTSYGVVDVNNKTSQSIDIKGLLNTKPSFGNITRDEPYILIYHTHSTEGYELLDLGWYSNDYVSRTEDTAKNMIRVGDELTLALQEAGFKVIHDRNIYDKSYNGAYDRSRVVVEEYLEKYPSIVLTLDVHRDAIHYDDGTKCKPTATVNGKKAAQVMIITGCEGEGVENFPRWEENLVFSVHLQNQVEESYEGLMRPIFFCNRKYNMNVTPCSVLLEFGTDANTLEEAVYSARLIGDSLGKLLDKNMG